MIICTYCKEEIAKDSNYAEIIVERDGKPIEIKLIHPRCFDYFIQDAIDINEIENIKIELNKKQPN